LDQKEVASMIGGELNYKVGNKYLDIAFPDKMIVVEIDAWYWHGHKSEKDTERDRFLNSKGWKILHIRIGGNAKLPNKEKILQFLYNLKIKEVEFLTWKGWGIGKTVEQTRKERKQKKKLEEAKNVC